MMKKYICILLVLFYFEGFSQENFEAGPVPFSGNNLQKDNNVNFKIGSYTSNIAYGYDILTFQIISVPVLPGYPFTYYFQQWPDYAFSMCLGGNGKFYLTSDDNEIHQFNPVTHQILLSALPVTGLVPGDIISGIAYNYLNNKYYLAAGNLYNNSDNIYELNISTGAAVLLGPTGTGGLQADLTFDCEGNCYSYDLITNNSYKININTGAATLLGPLGFNPAYAQGMDYDRENGIIYLSAFDSTTWHAQLRELIVSNGQSILIADWGNSEIAAFAISTKCYNECTLAASGNPYPPSGAFGVPVSLDSLRWENDSATTNTKVYFGKIENLQLVYDGPPITSFPVPLLNDQSLYMWRIISGNETGTRYSPSWIFSTMENPDTDLVFQDDFENDLGNWTIENVNGDCVWEIFQPPYLNHYVLPSSSSGGVLAADADNCGAQTTINSIAEINQSFDLTAYNWVWLEFDSDWKTAHLGGRALIDYSTNNGNTWTNIWDKLSSELRTSTEVVDVSIRCAGKSDVKFRFRSRQDWDWWWVIDNLKIYGMTCQTCVPRTPTNLTAYNIWYNDVILHWRDNSYNEAGFNIERKQGDSLSTHQFEIIGSTLPDENSFTDNTVQLWYSYTYRVNSFNENGTSGYSNCATLQVLPVPVELTDFKASQKADVVELGWTTASETNNFGFEVQRRIFMKDKNTVWATIAFKKGFGTTTEPKHYFYKDDLSRIDADSLYYRLKQVDFDGTSTLSGEVTVQVTKIPAEYKLYDNYPNPFNPSTIINYQIPKNSFVTLKVYDILGREVATLVKEKKLQGTYSVNFSAKGGSASGGDAYSLPSGIYFYQLCAGKFTETKKMVLLR